MVKFDIIVSKKENFIGYTGNPPSNETEYNAMKADMFSGIAPTWTEIKNEMDNIVDIETLKASAKQKLIDLGLTTEEIKALIGV